MMDGSNLRSQPVIEVRDLWKEYPAGDETVVALRDITLNIHRGRSAVSSVPPAPERAPCSISSPGWKSPPGARY